MEDVSSKDSKQFWKTVSRYTRERREVGNITLEKWENYFKNLFVIPATQVNYVLRQNTNETNDILDADINLEEVKKAINSLKTNKAAGYDGIPGEFYRALQHDLSDVIVYIFNGLFRESYFPMEWSKSLIVPLPKKGDMSRVENYQFLVRFLNKS